MCEVIVTRNTSAGISLLSCAPLAGSRAPGAGSRPEVPWLAADRPSWARPADSLSGPLGGRPVLQPETRLEASGCWMESFAPGCAQVRP